MNFIIIICLRKITTKHSLIMVQNNKFCKRIDYLFDDAQKTKKIHGTGLKPKLSRQICKRLKHAGYLYGVLDI